MCVVGLDLPYCATVTIAVDGDQPPARLRVHGQLRPPLAEDVLVTASVGPSGEAIALWANPADREALLAPAGRAGSCAKRPVPARVVVQTAATKKVVTLAAVDLPFCQVQPLPDGQILVAAARGGGAVVFDADGEPVRRGNVRDGIEHLLTTPAGRIWIGYFDEGVYGGDSVAHHGIVRFTTDLEPDWVYPFDTSFGPVDDCYSLNVEAETAWSCYYGDFPIVRISDGTVTGWSNTTAGAAALITGTDACALIGGYRDDRDRVVIGHLTEGRYAPTAERRLAMPDGRPLTGQVRMLGRGPQLHVFDETTWYRLDLDDLT
jgi:hypothetical protein